MYKDPKETAKKIDRAIMDKYGGLDDILESHDGKFFQVNLYNYALKGMLVALTRLVRSLERIVLKNESEIATLSNRHRCKLSPDQQQRCTEILQKYAGSEHSPTMKALLSGKVKLRTKP